MWGKTVYINLWQPGELAINLGNEIIEIGASITKPMVAKFLELCSQNLESKGLNFEKLNQELQANIEKLFGGKWKVIANTKESNFQQNELQNEERFC